MQKCANTAVDMQQGQHLAAYLEVLHERRVDTAWGYDDGEHGTEGKLCDDGIGALWEGPHAVPCLFEPHLLL